MSGSKNVSLNPGAYPALRVALIYAAGIWASRLLPADFPLFWIFAATGLLTVTCVLVSALKQSLTTSTYGLYMYGVPLLYLLSIAGFGMLQFRLHEVPPTSNEEILRVFDADDLMFFGSIRALRTTRSGNMMLTMDIDSVHIRGLPVWYRPFRTEVFTSEELHAGAYLHFRGDLDLPDPPRNPHQFDYASFLSRQGIHSRIFANRIHTYSTDHRASFLLRHQLNIRTTLSSLFSESNSALAKAIVLGDRTKLDPDLRTGFSRAGLAHLMAVSGMHVGFILLPLWLVLPWFRGSSALRLTGLMLGGLLLLFYAGITGFSVSVSRASLMAFFLMLARLHHKPGTSMNILGMAAFILLLLDPLMLFDVGFQLSFLAVMIILTTLPATRTLLPMKYRYRNIGALFQFVMVSVLVQGGLYPLLILYFQEFSIAGPLSNTLAVPFVQFMFLWSFLCLGISIFEPAAATVLNIPGDLILSGLTHYVQFIGEQPASWIEQTLASPWLFGVWFFGFAFLASLRFPSLRWKMTAGLLACLLLIQADLLVDRLRRPTLKVTFYDVGQGDAALLQTPGGHHFLYDVGTWSPNHDSGERTLIPELRAMGIRKLDGIILSHPHADHIGGMESLMRAIPVDTIYQSPQHFDSQIYQRYMRLAGEMETPVRLLFSGEKITVDPSMPMLVLSPSDEIPARDPNNRSVVLKILYGDTRWLLTGDAEKEAETYLVDTYGDFLDSDFLKVGHHASSTSSTMPFLQKVNAAMGVASLAKRNRYRHPHVQATQRLQNAGVGSRFTSLEGAVIYKSDGDRVYHVPWRREH